MPAASAPVPPAYDVCTPAQWDDWYTAIGVLGDGGTDFGLLETVGQEGAADHGVRGSGGRGRGGHTGAETTAELHV
jgi:hypothetical protein